MPQQESKALPAHRGARRTLPKDRSMNARRSRWSSLAALPAAFLSLLPAVTCSACLGAYAGLFSALGLGFLVQSAILEPVLISTLLVGRYVLASQEMQWLGFPLILGGALWNVWLRRRRSPLSRECAACGADQPGPSQLTKPKEASR